MRSPRHYDTLSRLTARQLQAMELISRATCTTRGALRDAMKLRSNNALDNHLLALEAKWLIARAPSGVVSLTARGIERLAEEAVAA